MICENGCMGNGSVLGTVEANITSLMTPLVNGGMPFVAIVNQRPLGVGEFMFEKTLSEDSNGRKILNFKFKEGMGSGSKFQYLRTNSDCQLEWREQFYNVPSAKVTVTATAAATLTVDNINGLRGIGTGSKIQLFVSGKLVQKTIASVAGNVITLLAGQTITAPIGACVYRGAYSRSKNCSAQIDNSYDLRQEVKYISNYRNISLSLEFLTCELSVDRFVNYMGDNGTTRFINEFKQTAVEGFVEEFRYAFWMDRNLKAGIDIDGNTVGGVNENETMGLIPAIQRSQIGNDVTLIHDHSECCDPLTPCASDSNVVAGFFDIIRTAYRSGLYNNGVVTVVGNSTFIENVQKMQAAFQDVNGIQVTYNQPDNGTYAIRQTLPTISLGGINIEFLQDEFLDRIPTSFYVVLPKDQVYFTQRAYGHLTSDLTTTNEINQNISTGFPWLKFKDRTEIETNGLGDCYKYVSDFQFAIAFGGMDHKAYHIGLNFGPCTDTCNTCDESGRVEVL